MDKKTLGMNEGGLHDKEGEPGKEEGKNVLL